MSRRHPQYGWIIPNERDRVLVENPYSGQEGHYIGEVFIGGDITSRVTVTLKVEGDVGPGQTWWVTNDLIAANYGPRE